MGFHELSRHKPVLVDKVLYYLNLQPGKIYLDVTFGSGGHTRAILEKEPQCDVVAMDWDAQILEKYGPPLKAEFEDRLRLLWGNFALLYKIAKRERIGPFDGILADFGTSLIQITERPGFSIYRDTPLDMRMSPAHQRLTASELVAKASARKLQEVFWQFGEERYAKHVAQAIVKERLQRPIKTTRQLAHLIERIIPFHKRDKIHPATKIFQALRIYINKELENIRAFLAASVLLLKPGGQLVCICFHSLEDRLVKQFFQEKKEEGKLIILTKKVVVPSKEEIQENPSARSAKLRAAKLVVKEG
ncbi:16S rRNA (cytosine(1402)-N(4))-methyltransferase RsmH [Candidatus Dependentiae bacterium]|nr:MAG: 16S rRNA (cytosine(1402)-N(4))-methyltransferase RsmH [Candidatus Dependentiae bacterium]